MHDIMQHSTSKHFLCAVVGSLADMILGRQLPAGNSFTWIVRADRVKQDRSDVTQRWRIAIESILPLVVAQAGTNTYETVRSAQAVEEVRTKVAFTMQSIKNQLDASLSPIRDVSDVK